MSADTPTYTGITDKTELVGLFLDDIATSLNIPSEELVFEAELRNSGPTYQAGPNNAVVAELVTAQGGPAFFEDHYFWPDADYDSLSSKHMEYRVVRRRPVGTKGVTTTDRLYRFQLLPLYGNCGLCIHRWVYNSSGWSKALRLRALEFRRQWSCLYSYGAVVVTAGPSYRGSELVSEFTHLIDTPNYRYSESRMIKMYIAPLTAEWGYA